MKNVERITHCTFTCRDYAGMVKFYSEILGLKKLFALDYDQASLEMLTNWGFDVSGYRPGQEWLSYYKIRDREFIELFNTPYQKKEEEQKCGFHHVCLLVEDLYDVACELENKGVSLWEGPSYLKKGIFASAQERDKFKLSSFFVEDVEGNQIQFMM